MTMVNISVRVDPALKKQADALFSDLGLNMSTAVNMFLKTAVSHNGIPFEVRRPTPNAETRAALAEYKEMKRNPAAYKRYDTFEDLMGEVLDDA
ncbi:MAG: type II toxin-antitoxin system RelB/DinJ family antitoxin [Clostridia bacterium]|nr:type II toxin-antitoxin system RelB/DinJ family antitoxin [Clostridia bacterium]